MGYLFKIFPKILKTPRAFLEGLDEKSKLLGSLWEKFENFSWKFNSKIEFVNIIGKVVGKNRAIGNNIVYLQEFFQFRGRANVPYVPTPWRRLCIVATPLQRKD